MSVSWSLRIASGVFKDSTSRSATTSRMISLSIRLRPIAKPSESALKHNLLMLREIPCDRSLMICSAPSVNSGPPP
jgi:hypothetical protein